MAKQVSFNGYLIRQFGAYIRTDLSNLVQVNGVASGIIGITGLAEKGPTNEPVTITSYSQLVTTFGDGPLVRHGLAAYIGGANTLVAVRLDDDSSPDAATPAFQNIITSTDAYTFRALESGTYGNNISVRVVTPVFADGEGNPIVASTDTTLDTTPQYSGFEIPTDVSSVTNVAPNTIYVVENFDYNTGYDPASYSIYNWNGSRWAPVDVATVTSTVFVRFGSAEEQISIPYYINETPWVKALAEATATDYYYVLKNKITGQVRPIPDTWLAGEIVNGVLDDEVFDQVVNDLKSEDEILFNGTNPSNFQISLSTPTQFPFELIEAIINFGGFGSGPSAFITVDLDDSQVGNNPQLVSQGFTPLFSGYNSEDGTGWSSTEASLSGDYDTPPVGTGAPTSAWDKALAVFENEEVNFIQPAYLFSRFATFSYKYSYFKSLAAKLLAHVTLMSNTPNRKFRTSILGIPSGQNGEFSRLTAAQFLTQTQDVSGVVNNDRIQLWAGGFFSTALETVRAERLYGAEWIASFAAGAHAAREVSVSLTFSPMAGILTGGLEYAWTTSQKDDLYGRSLAFILKRRTSTGATDFIAAHNYTSFTGAPSKGLQLFITRRIVDFMNTFVYKNLEENFIGSKSRGAETAARLREYVNGLLSSLVTQDILVAYTGLSVTTAPNDPTVFLIDYTFQPVTEINFILTTNRLVYNLA
jgi:hypothetical protein